MGATDNRWPLKRCSGGLASGGAAADEISLFLIDPVDGSGPNPQLPQAALSPAGFTAGTLIIGAKYGGRCAPEKVNHRLFARMAPPGSGHVILPMGHLDVMDSKAHRLGRWLCGSGTEPDLMRKTVADLILKQAGSKPLALIQYPQVV